MHTSTGASPCTCVICISPQNHRESDAPCTQAQFSPSTSSNLFAHKHCVMRMSHKSTFACTFPVAQKKKKRVRPSLHIGTSLSLHSLCTQARSLTACTHACRTNPRLQTHFPLHKSTKSQRVLAHHRHMPSTLHLLHTSLLNPPTHTTSTTDLRVKWLKQVQVQVLATIKCTLSCIGKSQGVSYGRKQAGNQGKRGRKTQHFVQALSCCTPTPPICPTSQTHD